jgi:hypothetical protein
MNQDRQTRERRPVRRLDGRQGLPEQHAFYYPDHQQSKRPPQRSSDQAVLSPGPDQRQSRRYPPASTHRAGHYSGIHPEDAPYTTGDDLGEREPDEPYYPRSHTSVRTYNQPAAPARGNVRYEFRPDHTIPRRAHAVQPPAPPDTNGVAAAARPGGRQRRGFRFHALVYLGVGMLVMLALWVGLRWVEAWWQVHSDDATFGHPRTYQFDALFGHSDSAANPTHIIIVNLNRHIIVIELPGGDPTHARIYSGPTLFGDGQDLTPVTGKAIDVNGDGKLDLVLFIQDQRMVFLNDGTQFRPLKPGEHVTLPQ